MRDADDSSRGCSVLARIPCTALCVFLLVLSATIACFGALFIGFHRTIVVISNEDVWPWFPYALIGVGVGMLTVATSYLIIASVSAVQSRSATGRQYTCLRVLNLIVLVVGSILQMAWTLLDIAIGAAVLITLSIYNMYYYKNPTCINLAHYALPRMPHAAVCHEKINPFFEDILDKELLVCYSASLICAIMVTFGLNLLVISTTHNYAQLKTNMASGDSGRVRGSSGMRTSAHLMPYNDGLGSCDTAM